MNDPSSSSQRKITRLIRQKILVNPYYFGLLLLGLLGINIYYVIGFDKGHTPSLYFFLFYAFGQSFLEVLVLALVAGYIRTYFHRAIYYFFISLCFLSLFIHYVDFVLIRLMDRSFFYALDMILDETLENFIELLHLSGVGINWWILLAIGAFFILPIIALSLYFITVKLSKRKLLRISLGRFIQALCCIPIGLLALDLTFSPFVKREEYFFYQRALPWKSTFLNKAEQAVTLPGPLKPLSSPKNVLKKLHTLPCLIDQKPNIFLFITESLREDFLTCETAPHICHFRRNNICLGKTFSNANATQVSWYAIFHANYPFYWASVGKRDWQVGSVPLQILKKLGYKIRVYSAAQLKYYGMNESIFGKRLHLADSYYLYPHYWPMKAWQADEKAINKLVSDLDQGWAKQGNVFIVFLDSTHFNYSWPMRSRSRFTPVNDEKTDFRVSHSIKDIELIKNRYRNAIDYVDTLFGKTIQKMQKNHLYEDALVIFTGDHGEEFYEEGKLFHASHLSWMQTRAPIYYKLGDNRIPFEIDPSTILSSHIDIFPTLFHYLLGKETFASFFHGESILKQNRFPYVITARDNGVRAPYEFFIHDGRTKLVVRLLPEKRVLHAKKLEIISLQDMNDQIIPMGDEEQVRDYVQETYPSVFKHLFQTEPH